MVSLWPRPRTSPPVVLAGEVELRVPRMEDYELWAEARAGSRNFLQPWEPIWPVNDLTRGSFRTRIRCYNDEAAQDRAYPFFVFLSETGCLVGAITLSNVRRGVSQAASVGYWIGEPWTRQGYMGAAVKGLLHHAFDTLHLHRVEASCLPENRASIGLLRKAGFVEEGLARAYLRINGQWRDHLLFAKIAGDEN